MQSLATGFGLELEALPAKKSAVEKLWLAAAWKQITSVSNGWLATRLQMGAATSVGSLVSNFRSSGGIQGRATWGGGQARWRTVAAQANSLLRYRHAMQICSG